jgi:hypothetical protein
VIPAWLDEATPRRRAMKARAVVSAQSDGAALTEVPEQVVAT